MGKYFHILTGVGLLITFIISIAYFSITRLILPENSQLITNYNVLGSQTAIDRNVWTVVQIGKYYFSLFGYTSPQALVTIEGVGIYDQTYANKEGFFSFDNSFSPLSPRETCLQAQDQFGRNTAPVCLPPFPTTYNTTIGPIIMPPTLSFDKNDYYMTDQIELSGQTIPNTSVDLSVFIDENKSIVNYIANSLVKSVEAITFPELSTNSDEKGNYSISIPSSHPNFYRMFMTTNYLDSDSPKSITLNIKVLPIWMIIIKFFLFIFSLIKSRIIEMFIIGEIIILFVYYLHKHLQPHIIARNKALTLRGSFPLVLVK